MLAAWVSASILLVLPSGQVQFKTACFAASLFSSMARATIDE